MKRPAILAALLILSGLALASDPPIPERDLPEPGAVVLRMYDVRDLVTGSRPLEHVVSRVRGIVGAGGQVTARAGMVILRAPSSVHAKVSALFEVLRRHQHLVVTVETRIVRSRGEIAPMVPERGTLDLEAEQVRRLLEGLGEKAEILSSPRLSCRDGLQATVSLLNQVAYVSDYEVEVASDGSAAMASPIVENLDEGVTLDVRPVVSRDRKRITLLLEATVSTIRRPIETVKVDLGTGHEVSIQVPETVKRTWRRALTLDDGGHALLDLGAVDPSTGERLTILLSASLTDLAEEETGGVKKQK